jgi:glycine/D-amino acid oxidase-like deaminating enzyme
MVALHPQDFPLNRTVETEEIYLVPRDDGRILVGATVEEVGFHEGNTAGGVRHLLAAAAHLFPALEASALGEIWSGLRPASIDGNPILGKDPVVEGLFHASGHYRNGVLLAPATAQTIAPLLLGGGDEAIPEEFSPARFGTG